MAQTFFPIAPVLKTIGVQATWTEIDASGDIPVGATGVVIHFQYDWDATGGFGLRKNGSTDNRFRGVYDNGHAWGIIGVDGSRIFEAQTGETPAKSYFYIIGYTMAGVTFLTNGQPYSLVDTLDWEPIDCTAHAPSAIGLIFEADMLAGLGLEMGLRKNGSSDDRTQDIQLYATESVIIGCDASQICQGYIETTDVDFYLIGYITDGCTFILNATDLSLGATGSWLDLPTLPANAVMGFIENTYNILNFGLRKNGSAETIIGRCGSLHDWAFVECDGSQLIEGNISSLATDFFLVGYAEVPPPGWTGKISGVTDPAKVMGVDVANIEKVKGVVSA